MLEPAFEATKPKTSSGNLETAMAAFMSELPSLKATSKAKIETKSGRTIEFGYLKLPDMLEILTPLLAKHGLWISQPLSGADGSMYITTNIRHISGQCLSTAFPIDRFLPSAKSEQVVNIPDPKQFGIVVSYLRRYCLMAALGISSDGDMDGDDLAPVYSSPKLNKSSEDEARANLIAQIKNQREVLGMPQAQLLEMHPELRSKTTPVSRLQEILDLLEGAHL
jgi:hypothetical protein